MKKLFFLIPMLLLAASCSLESSSEGTYTTTGFATVKDGNLQTDDGYTFMVTEDSSDGKWKEATRIIYSGSITGTVISGQTYSLSLEDYAVCRIKDVLLTGTSSESFYGSDPVGYYTGAVSGGYLNVMCLFFYKENSTVVHDINLVKDEENSTDSCVKLLLRHNGHGEVYSKDDATGYTLDAAWYSFPITGISSKSTELAIFFDWYATSGNSYTTEVNKDNAVDMELTIQ